MAEDVVNSPYYRITFEWDSIDFSLCVDAVHVVNHINMVYQTIIIEVGIREKDIVENSLYGHKNMKLLVELTTEDSEDPVESFAVDLMAVHTLGDMTIMPEKDDENSQYDHGKVNKGAFVCLPVDAYNMMTQSCNALAQNTDPKSPFDMAKDLVDKFITVPEVEVDDRNGNTYTGEQLSVPPMNFAATMDHIDDHYGIFKGFGFFQCCITDDGSKFVLWDLSQKMKDAPVYTVYYLAQGKDDKEVMEEVGMDSEYYYTYTPIQTINRTNEIAMSVGKIQSHVICPSDDLYSVITVDADDVWSKNTVIDGGELQLLDAAKQTEDILTRDNPGLDYDESWISSKLAKVLSMGVERSFKLDRNLRITSLMQVGIPIDFVPESASYGAIQGKHIIKSSKISLRRGTFAHFQCIATIVAFRGNAEI